MLQDTRKKQTCNQVATQEKTAASFCTRKRKFKLCSWEGRFCWNSSGNGYKLYLQFFLVWSMVWRLLSVCFCEASGGETLGSMITKVTMRWYNSWCVQFRTATLLMSSKCKEQGENYKILTQYISPNASRDTLMKLLMRCALRFKCSCEKIDSIT